MESSTRSGTSVPWPGEVAVAALSGVVTAYLAVHRWTRGARWALHGGVGATTAVAVAVMMRAPGVVAGPDADREPAGVRASVALTLVMAAADRHTAPRRAELQIVPGSEGGGGEPGVGG